MQVLHNAQIRFNVIGEATRAPCHPGNSFFCPVTMPETVSRNRHENKQLGTKKSLSYFSMCSMTHPLGDCQVPPVYWYPEPGKLVYSIDVSLSPLSG